MRAYIKDDFKNLLEYRQWVDQQMKKLSFRNKGHEDHFEKSHVDYRIRTSPKWYGEGTSFEEMAKGITEYKSPELIDKIYNQVNDKISTSTRDRIKARKIKYNPNGLGIFIFDRAAMGMYRLSEFYSPSHSKVVQDYEVQGKPGNYQLIQDDSEVLKRLEQKENGKPKIRTSSKNVFAYFPPVNRENKAVELYISCGGHAGISSEQFLYSGISALIVGQLLEVARIKTRISIVIGSSPDNHAKTAFASIIPVKNYDENLDTNLLALLSSDPRFFRYEGFKGIVATYDHFGAICPGTLGMGLNKQYLIKMIEQSDYAKKASIAPNRFYFGWTFSEAEATAEISKTIAEIAERIQQ